MCLICEKYGISKSSYDAMVRNGVISTTFPGHEEIFIYYKQCLKVTSNQTDAITKTAEDKRISERSVYRIITEFS